MNIESLKEEYIKIKKEELEYIHSISLISKNKTFSDEEKLEIYRELNNYANRLNEAKNNLNKGLIKDKPAKKLHPLTTIIEFDVDDNLLSAIRFKYDEQKQYFLDTLGIDKDNKFKLDLLNIRFNIDYKMADPDIVMNGQRLIEQPIYIFDSYYYHGAYILASSFHKKNKKDDVYAVYEEYITPINTFMETTRIPEEEMQEFEKDKIVIYSEDYLGPLEIKWLLDEELLNTNNNTVDDCIKETMCRIKSAKKIKKVKKRIKK